MPLQIPSWTCRNRALPFLMRQHLVERHLELVHQPPDATIQRRSLQRAGRLTIKIAQRNNPDVAFVVIFHVRALPLKRPPLPNPALSIDCKVISNVAPPLISMRAPNGFHPPSRRSQIAEEKRIHSIVMDGDVLNRQHAIHQACHRPGAGPLRARNHVADRRMQHGRRIRPGVRRRHLARPPHRTRHHRRQIPRRFAAASQQCSDPNQKKRPSRCLRLSGRRRLHIHGRGIVHLTVSRRLEFGRRRVIKRMHFGPLRVIGNVLSSGRQRMLEVRLFWLAKRG